MSLVGEEHSQEIDAQGPLGLCLSSTDTAGFSLAKRGRGRGRRVKRDPTRRGGQPAEPGTRQLG